MKLTDEQLEAVILVAAKMAAGSLSEEEGGVVNNFGATELYLQLGERLGFQENKLFIPNYELAQRIDDYEKSDTPKSQVIKGYLMEEIACLVFKSVKGWDTIKSYTSYSEQHDLVVSGSSMLWLQFLDYLQIPKDRRTIVVEAKYHDKKLSAQQFSRLCYLLQNKFERTCDLGIFFTHKGATGFGTTRVLRDARACQVLFHARTGKYIIVLDRKDILTLRDSGSFLKILVKKIRDVEEVSLIDMSEHSQADFSQVQLPSHLSKYFQDVEQSQLD